MMMNKIIIPTILAATILVVGMFALIPVDTASTIHFTLLQGIFGSSVVLTESVSGEIAGTCCTETEYHQFILSSEKPFTIHDITVKGNLNATTSSDEIKVRISAYPEQYGEGAGSATDADDDSRLKDVLDDTGDSAEVVDGNDDEIPQTWSLMRADADQSTGEAWFGPNQNVIVEIEFRNSGGDDIEYNAMVSFYLRGVLGENVDVDVHEDTSCIFCE